MIPTPLKMSREQERFKFDRDRSERGAAGGLLLAGHERVDIGPIANRCGMTYDSSDQKPVVGPPETVNPIIPMLYKAKTLQGYQLHSHDGEIGKVKEFYFDDRHWTVRYLVADTGNWLTGWQVLLSPYTLGAVNHAERNITVELTKKQIENSPSLASDKPVSRQFEDIYSGYYAIPMYWGGSYSWGAYPYPQRDPTKWAEKSVESKNWDPNLRSTRDVTGHHLEATDGAIGHVEDFIIDPKTWAIRYLVVDTRNWFPGKTVLISPQWIERLSWPESKVFVSLSREEIKASPGYSDDSVLDRDYETILHAHYNRPGYWSNELVAK